MFYIILFLKVFILEYLIIIFHELTHLILYLLYGFRLKFFHIIPFTIYKNHNKVKISLKPRYEPCLTGRLHFESMKISSSLSYSMLKHKLKAILFVGPLFDFTVFTILFVLGISLENCLFLTITALLHFCIASITFFNSDGKYAVGAKEDPRICYCLISKYTLFGNGIVMDETKRIMTDKYLEVSNNVKWEGFEVTDLWNYLNNIDFYTDSLYSYLNGDLLSLDNNFILFMESIISDFDKINYFDYRQCSQASKSIILYYIYKKIENPEFVPNKIIYNKVLQKCNSNYFKVLLNYYFDNSIVNVEEIKTFLMNEYNMPISCRNCYGYSKIYYNLVSLKK